MPAHCNCVELGAPSLDSTPNPVHTVPSSTVTIGCRPLLPVHNLGQDVLGAHEMRVAALAGLATNKRRFSGTIQV
jgi:hypothetical protein